MDITAMKSFKITASRIEGLDLSIENGEVEACEAEIAKIQSKIEEAEARSTELSQLIRDYEGPDPEAVANALMDGTPAREAGTLGTSKEELITENRSLRAAIGKLRERERDQHQRIREIRTLVSAKVAEVMRPLIDEISEVQVVAAQSLVSSYGAIRILNDIANHFTPEESRSRSSLDGVMGSSKILPFKSEIPLPSPLIAALEPLTHKGRSCRAHVREKIIIR